MHSIKYFSSRGGGLWANDVSVPRKVTSGLPGWICFCTVPRPYFLGRALTWPGYFGEHVLGLFGLYPSSLSKSVGFVSLSYFYDPGMFIFRWKSNFVEKVVLKGSMAAKMAFPVSYLVYSNIIVYRVNLNKLSRNFVRAFRTATTNCRVSFTDLYLV